jgi:hypothetical protein
MQNITLSAPANLIEAAREEARARNSTLNAEFRAWLAEFTERRALADRAMAVMNEFASLRVVDSRRFTREEMNERR